MKKQARAIATLLRLTIVVGVQEILIILPDYVTQYLWMKKRGI